MACRRRAWENRSGSSSGTDEDSQPSTKLTSDGGAGARQSMSWSATQVDAAPWRLGDAVGGGVANDGEARGGPARLVSRQRSWGE